MSLELPPRPNLDHLRKAAKRRLALLRQRNPSASLVDAQHVLAREYSFSSWPKLKVAVRVANAGDGAVPPVGPPSSPSAEGDGGDPGGFARYTDRARRALFFSRWEASQLGSAVIEPEHMTLGVVHARKGLADVAGVAINIAALRVAVLDGRDTPEAIGLGVAIPFSEATMAALVRALKEADHRGHAWVSTGHVLLGVLGDAVSLASNALRAQNLSYSAVASDAAALGRDA
jgi:hypothetical protein